MEEVGDPHTPASIILLLGGPIDARVNPTVVNRFTEQHGTEWFRQNVIAQVPFLTLALAERLSRFHPAFEFHEHKFDRHITRNQEFFLHLMRGDQEFVQKHRAFTGHSMTNISL